MQIRPFHPAGAVIPLVEDNRFSAPARKNHCNLVPICPKRPIVHNWSAPLHVADAVVPVRSLTRNDDGFDITDPEREPDDRVSRLMNAHLSFIHMCE